MKNILLFSAAVAFLMTAAGCSGRKADNMQPTGETIEVVIPTEDILPDSVIANTGEDINL